MDGDPKIKSAFELADDAMQGLLGYHLYVAASAKTASFGDKFSRLPKDAIPHTWSWNRFYSAKELIENMEKLFDFIHARFSLVMLVAIFEVAIRDFAARFNEESEEKYDLFKGVNPKKPGYKTLLKRAINFAILNKESHFDGAQDEENKRKIQRVLDLCLDVDDARRLRNQFIHHHGLFDESYEKSAIEINGKIRRHPHYLKLRKNPKEKVPVLLTPEEYIAYSRSHIELLHYLHDLIQRKYFGLTGSGYYYKGEGKLIEWRRVLIGV